jgi:hypothetical protein
MLFVSMRKSQRDVFTRFVDGKQREDAKSGSKNDKEQVIGKVLSDHGSLHLSWAEHLVFQRPTSVPDQKFANAKENRHQTLESTTFRTWRTWSVYVSRCKYCL